MFELKDFSHLFFSKDEFCAEELLLADSPIYLSSFSQTGLVADEILFELVNRPYIMISWL